MAPTATGIHPSAPNSSSSSSDPGALSPEQLSQFHRDGYLVLPRFFDPSALLSRAKDLVQEFSLEGHPLTTFSTGRGDEGEDGNTEEVREKKKHVGDRYFLESGDKVRFFLEEEAVGPDGKLNRDKSRAVNKVGHALHLHDPHFHEFSFSQSLQSLARSLNVHKDPRVLQSMIICKQPSIGGAVPHHNDSTFLYTDPPSAIGFWFALEDCTTTNGCLSFLKGSHRWPTRERGGGEIPQSKAPRPLEDEEITKTYGPPRGINARFVRKKGQGEEEEDEEGEQGTTFLPLAQDEEADWKEEEATVEECEAGSLVLIHGSVLHQSKKNLSEKSRYIYTFHMIEGDPSRARFDELNWLQMPRLQSGPNDNDNGNGDGSGNGDANGKLGQREPFSSLYRPPPPPASTSTSPLDPALAPGPGTRSTSSSSA